MGNANSASEWLQIHCKQAVCSVKNLTGLTACSQLVTLKNGKRYVLRTQTPRATNFGINYQQEAQLLNTIFPLGFSPKSIYYDQHFSLLAWIEGEIPSTFSYSRLIKLAEHLARLHQFPIQAVNSTKSIAKLDLSERCQYLWDKLPKEKQAMLPFSPPFQQIQPLTQAVCHHDLHLGNFVEQGNKLFLIDWEYAAISDPALELALFLNANPLSNEEQATFLTHYFVKNPINPIACKEKIDEYKPILEQLNQLWYVISQVFDSHSHL